MFAAMTPLLLALVYILFSLKSAREQEATDAAFRSGQLAAFEIQRIISGFEGVLLTLASAPSLREQDMSRCTALLSEASRRLPGVATLGFIDSKGTITCRNDGQGLGLSLADRAYFQEALATDSLVVSTFIKSRITSQNTLPLALRVLGHDGAPIGVLGLSVDLNWFQQRVAERSYSPGSSITLADRNGVIIARYPYPERFVGTEIPKDYKHLVNAPAPGTFEVTSQDGTKRILAYFPVSSGPAGLYLSTGISTEEAYATVRSAVEVATAAATVAVLLSAFLAWQTSHYAIAKPMQTIRTTLAQWRSGDSRVRTGMVASHEFGEIGSAIDQFMDELEASRQQQELLIGELGHRIKNILATVQSIARQTFRKSDASVLDTFSARLTAMGNAFDLLTTGSWQATDLLAVVKRATEPFNDPNEPRFRIQGQPQPINARAALAFSMALHELCTNAVKYGALSNQNGFVSVDWNIPEPGLLLFKWQEQGGPPVERPSSSGFGKRMIERVLAQQVGANVEAEYQPRGFRCKVAMPLNEHTTGLAPADAAPHEDLDTAHGS
jgi:two-component sensor histidine kinase